MTEDEKRLFDALAEWKKEEFERINERRDSEWKTTLAVWAGLGALSLGVITETEAQEAIKRMDTLALPIAATILVTFHALFLRGVGLRHHQNRKSAFGPTCRMANMLGTSPPDPPRFSFLDWSRSVQLGMSLFLAALVVLLRVYV